MHRFLPIYASCHGAKMADVVANDHLRRAGRLEYGLESECESAPSLIGRYLRQLAFCLPVLDFAPHAIKLARPMTTSLANINQLATKLGHVA
jgi:hypothetical protein